jgi:hypothetical protein
MPPYALITNEGATPAEWTSLYTEAGSTCALSTAKAKRGVQSLHVATVAGKLAYGVKTLAQAVAPGASIYLGFWLYVDARPAADIPYFMFIHDAVGNIIAGAYSSAGNWNLFDKNDANGSGWGPNIPVPLDQWCWVVVRITRATTDVSADGSMSAWLDGAPIAGSTANRDNFHRVATVQSMKLGCGQDAPNSFDANIDDVVLSADPATITTPPSGASVIGSRLGNVIGG